jgi:hypothetical protein
VNLARVVCDSKCFLAHKNCRWKQRLPQQIVRYQKFLVAGAGFEPAVRQLPDYELLRCKPVIA